MRASGQFDEIVDFLAGMRRLGECVPSRRFGNRETQRKAWFVTLLPTSLAAAVNELVKPLHANTLPWSLLELLHIVFWGALSLGIFERYLRRKALERAEERLVLSPAAGTDPHVATFRWAGRQATTSDRLQAPSDLPTLLRP
jgi:hypothetical protein